MYKEVINKNNKGRSYVGNYVKNYGTNYARIMVKIMTQLDYVAKSNKDTM